MNEWIKRSPVLLELLGRECFCTLWSSCDPGWGTWRVEVVVEVWLFCLLKSVCTWDFWVDFDVSEAVD